jgi:CRISPR-associated endonuclease Cas1
MQAREGTHAASAAEVFGRTSSDKRVCVVDGYGVRIAVERRHLVISDGIGAHRRERRFARIGHALERLVVLGHHGTISLEALRWMERTGIFFLQLDGDGQVITASANPGLNDSRLRRAQALAYGTDVGLDIIRTVLDPKLAGHANNAAGLLDSPDAAAQIGALRAELADAPDMTTVRHLERAAAHDYWALWPGRVARQWATKDRARIPDHWRRYTGRRSPIATGKPRYAADPLNAIINYLARLAEAECRRALQILGLDPGLGFLHEDVKMRDSAALDLIEAVRPAFERYVIELADSHVFRYSDFVERDDGHVRLAAALTHRLAETLPTWAAVVAPHAETIAHLLADSSPRDIRKATPLTGAKVRGSATRSSTPRRTTSTAATPVSRRRRKAPFGAVCQDCGTPLTRSGASYCPECLPARRAEAAAKGRAALAAREATAQGKAERRDALSRGREAARAARAATFGFEVNEWRERILPSLANAQLTDIARVTGSTLQNASKVRRGLRTPDPQHWAPLQVLTHGSGQEPLAE